jgi:citronellol/citronellal dehydrogenase
MNRLSNLSNNLVKKTNPSKITRHCSLKNKTLIISGASRGIGLAIAKRAAQDGANIVILAKTDTPHPKLPGTIHTAAKEIEDLGGRALPLKCDIRSEEQVKKCVELAVKKFGGIDIVVNNASAISLTGTAETSMKKYDLMNSVNTRGTFLLTKTCLPYLKKSQNAHVLMLSPPLFMSEKWFANHPAYTIAKYGMSMCVLGFAGEFREFDISVNALWPLTSVATSAIKHYLGGDELMRRSRKDTIVSDSAYLLFTSKGGEVTGGFFIDEELLKANGTTDFTKYKFDPKTPDEDIMMDYFIE